jgi:CheY-like chemotaxis protein
VTDEVPNSIEVCFSQTLSGKEKILFVDDDEMILMVHKDLLERRGYEVTTCADSSDALQTFEDFPNKFDLVITDQIMPNMTGIKLA